MGLFKKSIKEDKFTYNIQLAHFKNNEVEEKGETYQSHFMIQYQNFPWIEELHKENIITSPTMSITDHKLVHKLALSIVSNSGQEKVFHIFYIKNKKAKCVENKSESKSLEIVDSFFKRKSIKHYF